MCLITTLLMVGHNTYYTYIVPYFTGVNGFSSEAVAPLLLTYGGAGAIGLLLVGIFGARSGRWGLIIAVAFILVAVLAMSLLPGYPVVVIAAIVLWGAAFGGAPALLQTRVLHIASPQLRDVSSALVTTSFNIGIGGGALIGSLMLDGWGLSVLPFADLSIVAGVLVLIIVSELVIKRRKFRAGETREAR